MPAGRCYVEGRLVVLNIHCDDDDDDDDDDDSVDENDYNGHALPHF